MLKVVVDVGELQERWRPRWVIRHGAGRASLETEAPRTSRGIDARGTGEAAR
ncbi:MAG TPA: hypothetical protein VIL13_08775 [Longimicrobiales bacterium]|jgi:hypothetical protein